MCSSMRSSATATCSSPASSAHEGESDPRKRSIASAIAVSGIHATIYDAGRLPGCAIRRRGSPTARAHRRDCGGACTGRPSRLRLAARRGSRSTRGPRRRSCVCGDARPSPRCGCSWPPSLPCPAPQLSHETIIAHPNDRSHRPPRYPHIQPVTGTAPTSRIGTLKRTHRGIVGVSPRLDVYPTPLLTA